MNAIIYIHGKGGSAVESEHYKTLFPDCEVPCLLQADGSFVTNFYYLTQIL